ncbi:MAG: peptidylprolyl isomerase [Coriobacteriales bacterium]
MAAQLVKVHYKGTLDDGTVFDSSEGRDPIQFVEGAHRVIKGFEDAVAGMQPGDKTKIHLEPKDAYGDRDERLVQVIPVESIPNADKLPVGKTVYFNSPTGYPMPALVQKIEDGKVYLDFNHQLAGKALNFELELVSREDAPESECTHDCSTCGGCH